MSPLERLAGRTERRSHHRAGIHSLTCLGSALAAVGASELAEYRPHIDDMGYDLLVAWPDWMFTDLETLDEAD